MIECLISLNNLINCLEDSISTAIEASDKEGDIARKQSCKFTIRLLKRARFIVNEAKEEIMTEAWPYKNLRLLQLGKEEG